MEIVLVHRLWLPWIERGKSDKLEGEKVQVGQMKGGREEEEDNDDLDCKRIRNLWKTKADSLGSLWQLTMLSSVRSTWTSFSQTDTDRERERSKKEKDFV